MKEKTSFLNDLTSDNYLRVPFKLHQNQFIQARRACASKTERSFKNTEDSNNVFKHLGRVENEQKIQSEIGKK